MFCKLQNSLKTVRYATSAYGQALRLVSSDAAELVLVKEANGVREITLNHPRTLNSLSMDMMCALQNALVKDKDDVKLRSVVLSATGKIWSAGHNLKELHGNPEIQRNVFQKLTDIIRDIQLLPVPVIGKVNGYAAAAGCQLVVSCDIVVCSKTSKFSTPGAGVGVFCSTPGVAIGRVMSRPKSAYMLMTGLPVTGEEAYISGMVSRAVPAEDLDREIDEITGAINAKSRAVISLGKEFYYKQLAMSLKEAYSAAGQKMEENLQLGDCQEGIASFIEKRAPHWKHE
ncbi:enoyl-CoA hydratase domain-containing protein 3, mitochondrial [Drosophila subobscura]|uniref:enoyl-CoA hydratase domain-containing protein 3, mitochondrial n=1 Tax=Drosophila subobscura TaxID=7241 RepID=UPI00155A26DA|nr:enoyl-CoA hydratase domain-containing protein 3, mitochondrial [Drosophila subobscura]